MAHRIFVWSHDMEPMVVKAGDGAIEISEDPDNSALIWIEVQNPGQDEDGDEIDFEWLSDVTPEQARQIAAALIRAADAAELRAKPTA
jgi:hypothetical protein